jgi:hypothetical protein
VLAGAAAGVTGAAVSGLGASTSRLPAKPQLHSPAVAPGPPSGRDRHARAAGGSSTSGSRASGAAASASAATSKHAPASAGKRHARTSTGSTTRGGAVRAGAPSRRKSTSAKTRTSTLAPPATIHKVDRLTSAQQLAHQRQPTKTRSSSTQQNTSPATQGGASAGAPNTGAAQPLAGGRVRPAPAGA